MLADRPRVVVEVAAETRESAQHPSSDPEPECSTAAPTLASSPTAASTPSTATPPSTPPTDRRAMPTPPDPESAALVMYTSGTTGPPKGAVLSHSAIAANLDMLAEVWAWTAADVLIHALPLYHVHGLVLGVLGPLRLGGGLHSSRRLRCAQDGRGDERRRVPREHRDALRRPDDLPPTRRCGRDRHDGCRRPAGRPPARLRIGWIYRHRWPPTSSASPATRSSSATA